LLEFADTVEYGTLIDDMPFFSKYFRTTYDTQNEMPKFIIYLAHAETVA